MTFNIHHGKGIDWRLDLDRIVHVIKESQADLVGLNEVDRFFSKRSGYLDQISYLSEQLKMYYVFGAAYSFHWRRKSEFGNALLSRYPIISYQNHVLDFYRGIIEGRSLLEVKVQIKQQPLKIFVTHLSLNPLFHRRQSQFILKRVTNEKWPVIVLGDWNMKPRTNAWNTITKHLIDVCEGSNQINAFHTFPSICPTTRFDYIFVSGDFHISSVDILDTLPFASDHLPLTATLTIHKESICDAD